MPITVEPVDSPTDEARALIAELDAELAGPYPAENRHGLSVERVFTPNVRFFIARLDGRAVGCGGVAFDDSDLVRVREARLPSSGGCRRRER